MMRHVLLANCSFNAKIKFVRFFKKARECIKDSLPSERSLHGTILMLKIKRYETAECGNCMGEPEFTPRRPKTGNWPFRLTAVW